MAGLLGRGEYTTRSRQDAKHARFAARRYCLLTNGIPKTILLIWIQCDERKPVCSGCKRHSTDCLYQIQKCPKARKGSCFSSQQTADQSLHSPPQNSLPISPSSELDIGDLELLHQFLTFTCKATAQLPEVTAQVQRSILPMAQAYPFVMRGVLAMAAIHLSRLRPSRQEHYAMMAAQHHSKAFPEFQSALQNITEENCHALISFSKRLLWCSMAREESSDGRRVASKGADSWLPSWFHLLRGSCYLVEFARPWIEGDVNICPPAESPVDYSETSAHQQVVSLMSELLPMAQSTSCETVLTALQESFARAAMRHQNTPYRHAINFWVGSLPDDYVESLQKKEPWALVVLAHFCVLFHRSETVWFMRGHAMRLMLSITECLDPSWKRFIQWPCEELGIERSWDRNADASMTEL